MVAGGKRAGAGRKHSESSKQMRVPESMVAAVQGLKRIAKGDFRESDLAEIAIAVNQVKGAEDAWEGVVFDPNHWVREMRLQASTTEDLDKKFNLRDHADELWQRMADLGI